MNTTLSAIFLLSVPGCPLLLAFPALRSRLPCPWSCYIALLPAVILLAVPTVFSVDLPWLLFGAGLGIDGASRWLLAMSVLLWVGAATLLPAPSSQPVDNRFTTFFLLTLAANLGAILATDLVGFFAFSTLMGYSFYGLLVNGENKAARRAGCVYLCLFILADLALFEALLIAAATTEDLSFEAVRQAMGQSASPGLYLSMVLVGFALKAGAWPLHFWLPPAFRSARPAVALLLGGVPVAMGLLGAVRWLPLGEITLPELGLIIQDLGVVAMLYAVVVGLMQVQRKTLPACAAILATGLFVAALGAGLADPAVWNRYGNLAYFFIAFLGVGLAALTAGIGWLELRTPYSVASAKRDDDSSPWFARGFGTAVRWSGQVGFDTLPRLRTAWLAEVGRLLQIRVWQGILDHSERFLQRWAVATTLLLLLGMIVAFVGALFWI